MSPLGLVEPEPPHHPADAEDTDQPEPEVVEIRQSAGLSAAVFVAASGLGAGYLWRATGSSSVLDWALFALLAALAALHLAALAGARTPLLVADRVGVRTRLGRHWQALPWESIAQVALRPGHGLRRDGLLAVTPRNQARALADLGSSAYRQAMLNLKLYGAPLAVPLGRTSRVPAEDERRLLERLADLAGGRTQVINLPGGLGHEPALTAGVDLGGSPEDSRRGRRWFHWAGSLAGSSVPAESVAPSGPAVPAAEPAVAPAALAVPLRATRRALRAEVVHDLPSAWAGSAVPADLEDGVRLRPALPEERELRRSGSVDLVFEPMPADKPVPGDARVRPIAQLGEAVAPRVVDNCAPEHVIGPELAAARHLVRLSVDELSARTRIRPHIIESIEADDFVPCGGDFYARGHLRTLARALGVAPEPFLAAFDDRYAAAPINARRVFEAELATGMTGSMRSTVGGPRWGLLVGTVVCLVLVWSVARLFAGSDGQTIEEAPGINGSAGLASVYAKPEAMPVGRQLSVKLIAVNAGTHVVVRDAEGAAVLDGDLVLGEARRVRAEPPVRVTVRHGGVLTVTISGRDKGFLGKVGRPATAVYHRQASPAR